jgi:hypothetical protein
MQGMDNWIHPSRVKNMTGELLPAKYDLRTLTPASDRRQTFLLKESKKPSA